jgi:transposase, IS30 family
VIGTLVERSSCYVMLLHLPDGGTAAAVRDALTTNLGSLPAQLRRSLTWDQGKEMARHACGASYHSRLHTREFSRRW